ncbi:hypothetical protein PTNB73_07834 [Pyrenophora teres f. teres]|uniref:Uncharacterized protein n=1 Tax=Pyrenophora teres f. teres TaxID=97479 RepID=A0A6S6WF61_9PLEO|nr:hypothetical protein HRS9139_08116 [Pyrenophora teres f. teres]CAA9966628.1 hypothetical protein PTMSG1_09987 [Pyrenophora teres f. maculata]KAE8832462.1 hypothetical protein PTNB85_06854 [Pyrenophora teres f. teres]KAE8836930.1 hypothetical protein HRS9122_07085 [Pyrenophora teres f. teres]KAE8856124.1 hypothetical protein PTNB29_08963 [Pyrenophora teres f. teres]
MSARALGRDYGPLAMERYGLAYVISCHGSAKARVVSVNQNVSKGEPRPLWFSGAEVAHRPSRSRSVAPALAAIDSDLD